MPFDIERFIEELEGKTWTDKWKRVSEKMKNLISENGRLNAENGKLKEEKEKFEKEAIAWKKAAEEKELCLICKEKKTIPSLCQDCFENEVNKIVQMEIKRLKQMSGSRTRQEQAIAAQRF